MLIAAASPTQSAAQPASLFAPPGCEFSVDFPGVPTVDVGEPAGSRQVFVATYAANDVEVAVSCTTGYPPGAFAALTDDQIRGFVEGLVRRIGVQDARMRLHHDMFGRLVDVAGRIAARPVPSLLRLQIRYGDTSRLMVQLTTPDGAQSERVLEQLLGILSIIRLK